MQARAFAPAFFIIAIVALLGACAPAATPAAPASTASQAGITIERAWARPSSAMSSGMGGMENLTSAAYFTIKNTGPADKLTEAISDIAKSVEVHETKMEGGMASMAKVQAIDIPANGTVELKPGGYHVMLIGPVRELKVGDTFAITLVFEKAGKKQVQVTVQTPT